MNNEFGDVLYDVSAGGFADYIAIRKEGLYYLMYYAWIDQRNISGLRYTEISGENEYCYIVIRENNSISNYDKLVEYNMELYQAGFNEFNENTSYFTVISDLSPGSVRLDLLKDKFFMKIMKMKVPLMVKAYLLHDDVSLDLKEVPGYEDEINTYLDKFKNGDWGCVSPDTNNANLENLIEGKGELCGVYETSEATLYINLSLSNFVVNMAYTRYF